MRLRCRRCRRSRCRLDRHRSLQRRHKRRRPRRHSMFSLGRACSRNMRVSRRHGHSLYRHKLFHGVFHRLFHKVFHNLCRKPQCLLHSLHNTPRRPYTRPRQRSPCKRNRCQRSPCRPGNLCQHSLCRSYRLRRLYSLIIPSNRPTPPSLYIPLRLRISRSRCVRRNPPIPHTRRNSRLRSPSLIRTTLNQWATRRNPIPLRHNHSCKRLRQCPSQCPTQCLPRCPSQCPWSCRSILAVHGARGGAR